MKKLLSMNVPWYVGVIVGLIVLIGAVWLLNGPEIPKYVVVKPLELKLPDVKPVAPVALVVAKKAMILSNYFFSPDLKNWYFQLNKTGIEAFKKGNVVVRLFIGYLECETGTADESGWVKMVTDWTPPLEESRISVGLFKRTNMPDIGSGYYLSSFLIKKENQMPKKGYMQSEEQKRSKSEHMKGENNPAKRPEVRVKLSKAKLGKNRPDMSKKMKENNPMKHPEVVAKVSKALMGENSPFFGKKRPEQSEYMKNGGAAYTCSFNKSPSKPQVELYEKVKILYPSAVLNYLYGKYCIDIAIPHLKLAIEYDEPYWHQDKERDQNRQAEIEKDGWRFFRYSTIPSDSELRKIQQPSLSDAGKTIDDLTESWTR
jgi:hypothetical protein